MMQRDRLVNQRNQYPYKQILIMTSMLLVAACFGCSGLMAESSNTTLQISATVASNCLMQGETLSFGTYDPASANSTAALNATGSLQIRCTRNTSASISMDSGQYATQASGTTRAMRSNDGSHYLSYDLYLDSGHSTVWSTTNKAIYSASSGAATSTLAIYGAVPASQDVGDGQYNDVVTITANF